MKTKQEKDFVHCEFQSFEDCKKKECPFLIRQEKFDKKELAIYSENFCVLDRATKKHAKKPKDITVIITDSVPALKIVEIPKEGTKEYEEWLEDFKKKLKDYPKIPYIPFPREPQIPYVPPHPLYGSAITCSNCGAFIGWSKEFEQYAGPINCPVCGMDNSMRPMW